MISTPKVSIISGVQGDTRRYRAFHLYQQLRLAGLEVSLAHVTQADLRETAQADILILQRVIWDRNTARLVAKVRSAGGLVILDTDDLVFYPEAYQWIDSPDFRDPIRLGLYRENLKRNLATLENSDAVLTSTTYLATKVRELNKPVWIHRNGFSLEMYSHSNEAIDQQRIGTAGRVVIGYASGTPTHDQDFALVRPVLQSLLAEYPQVELRLIGPLDAGPGWGTNAVSVKHLDFVPWRRLPGLLAGLDINLAPLRTDNPFSQSKSEIKYLEAALVKVPTLASPTEAFQEAIRPGENGFLAGTPEEWEVCLRSLITEPALRNRLGCQAHQDALEHYSPWVRAGEIGQILEDIRRTVRPGAAPILVPPTTSRLAPADRRDLWIDPSIETRPTLVERGLYTIRVRGVLTLLKEIWVFFRRLVSPLFPFR